MTSPTAGLGPAAAPGSDRVLARLMSLHPKIIDLSLDRMERILALLGHPERSLPPVVHVAGTNGKGSVIAYLRAMLEAAGQRVHVYTSPHLLRFHERVRLAGELIGEDALTALLEECERVNGATPITYFEITTAAALLAYARTPGDILLLEVGLGGRLDATNVIDRPALSVVTSISVDHTQFLGEGIAQIAYEKAGILKPGVPAVSAPQTPEAGAVLRARAAALGAPFTEISFQAREDGFLLEGVAYPPPVLLGRHQLENAALAVASAKALPGHDLDDAAIRRGLAEAVWPGRMQRLAEGRLAALLPEGWELWLDGGHNAAAGEALAGLLDGWSDRPLALIYGMLNTKSAQGFLKPLARQARDLAAVAIPGEPASLSAAEAAAAARDSGFAAEAAESVAAALAALAAKGGPPRRVLICGSLYLAGRVLAENQAQG
ncbi:MAG: Mur ligase family protein [Rhodovibrionaceae bacterium]